MTSQDEVLDKVFKKMKSVSEGARTCWAECQGSGLPGTWSFAAGQDAFLIKKIIGDIVLKKGYESLEFKLKALLVAMVMVRETCFLLLLLLAWGGGGGMEGVQIFLLQVTSGQSVTINCRLNRRLKS